MTYSSERPGRVGQSKYWMVFGMNMIGVPVLLVGAVAALVNLQFGLAILAFLLVIPLGIYFRVTMMRRCRDIGWPAFLPWLLFGLQMLFGFGGGAGRVGMHNLGASLAMLTIPMTLALIDFAFSIVIGCIASKPDADYSDIFGGAPIPARPAQPRTAEPPSPDGPGYDRFDDAIARALAEHRRAGAEPAAQPEPSPHTRAVAGFGRKVV